MFTQYIVDKIIYVLSCSFFKNIIKNVFISKKTLFFWVFFR
jgi:hypothetical protein